MVCPIVSFTGTCVVFSRITDVRINHKAYKLPYLTFLTETSIRTYNHVSVRPYTV